MTRHQSLVRLSSKEYTALSHALAGYESCTYLFGSRTNMTKQGGDIDICIIYDCSPRAKLDLILTIQRTFTSYIDQKLDIVVLPSSMDSQQQRFFTSLSRISRGAIVQSIE